MFLTAGDGIWGRGGGTSYTYILKNKHDHVIMFTSNKTQVYRMCQKTNSMNSNWQMKINVLQLMEHICHEWVSCPGSFADESFDDSLVMNSCDVFIRWDDIIF